jgi:hypothetical protein
MELSNMILPRRKWRAGMTNKAHDIWSETVKETAIWQIEAVASPIAEFGRLIIPKIQTAIEDAVAEVKAEIFAEIASDPDDPAITAASEYVSSLPMGQRAWGNKEFMIARVSAGKAIADERVRLLNIVRYRIGSHAVVIIERAIRDE